MARTRVVATLGPASRDETTIQALIDAGVDVFRLNFSHGTHDEHGATIAMVRRLAGDRPVAILQDLGGPKLRCAARSRASPATSSTSTLPPTVRPGDPVLLADGIMQLEVVDAGHARVIVGGDDAGRQGHQPAVVAPRHPVADRQGPQRPALRRGAGCRRRGAVVRAAGRGPGTGARKGRPGDRQDRDRPGRRAHRRDRRGRRRRHGGARRPRRRGADRARAGGAEAADRARQPRCQAGHHRDPDAALDGRQPAADARRGHRRRECGARRNGRRHAERGDGDRPLSRRSPCA